MEAQTSEEPVSAVGSATPGSFVRRVLVHRLLVVASGTLALLVGLASTYAVSLSPPSIGPKAQPYGAASVQLFVDSKFSVLGDLSTPTDQLALRAPVVAQVAASDEIAARAASLAGIAPNSFQVRSATGSAAPSPSDAARVVTLTTMVDSPIIDLSAVAPTSQEATDLANAISRALREYVKRIHPQPYDARRGGEALRVRVRQLGGATGGEIKPAVDKAKGVAITLGIFALLLLMVYLYDIAIEHRRARRARGIIDRPAPAQARQT